MQGMCTARCCEGQRCFQARRKISSWEGQEWFRRLVMVQIEGRITLSGLATPTDSDLFLACCTSALSKS